MLKKFVFILSVVIFALATSLVVGVRSYADDNVAVVEGAKVVSQVPVMKRGQAIDLGLSVLWSDRNIGAELPSDYGMYFGYGDLTGEQISTSYDKYASEDIIRSDRDPAYVYWGAAWRMPSISEINELVERCEWHWVTIDGIDGFKVVGRNNQWIFLPAAGQKSQGKLFFEGKRGYYWSGEVNDAYPNYVPSIFFYKGNRFVKDYRKIYGFVIRPVSES